MLRRLQEITFPNPPLAFAVRESLAQGYRAQDLRADIVAGLTAGVIAIPLAMALAIAAGVPPQHGLYTAIVAGLVIALTGGSRVNVSGPTAAFVVILLPITHSYGVGGLVVASLMAGLILLLMGLSGLGRLIQFIPHPVTTGFTAGIAVVIATLQVKDFFGLEVHGMGDRFFDKLRALAGAWPTLHWADVAVGSCTLAIMLLWPRLKLRVPGHLIALVAATALAAVLSETLHVTVATIGSRFTYEQGGLLLHGIPPVPPAPVWPWNLPGPAGRPVGLSFDMIHALLGPAFAIAMLGAIESLLCAVVADGLSGTKHNPNAELIGQGLGNIAAPFFGGFAATAAIARTTANIRAGARSPLAAAVHALTVLLAVVIFAKWMGYIPMASLAALLLIVAWNMSDAKHFVNIIRVAPRNDVAVMLTCFGLTVIFDMVLAVGVGVVLAALLFMRRMASLTGVELVTRQQQPQLGELPKHVAVYDINGPLFFGAAEKAMDTLRLVSREVRLVIMDMSDVSMMDLTAIVALDSLIKNMNKNKVTLVISGLSARLKAKLEHAGIEARPDTLIYCGDLQQAREIALTLVPPR